jgi:8-oxo-dGTP diphosphatase
MPARSHSTDASLFRICPYCGTPLVPRQRHGHPRPQCPACGFVQWRNPVAGVAAILFESDIVRVLGEDTVRAGLWNPDWTPAPEAGRVLLVRRAASYRGTWCLPCGYVEFDEDLREAIVRETEEETGLRIRPEEVAAVHSNFHDPDRQSVGVWFRALPEGGVLRPGDDAAALGFFDPACAGVPLAFPTDRLVLQDLAAS